MKLFRGRPSLFSLALALLLVAVRASAVYTVIDLGVLADLPGHTNDATVNTINLSARAVGMSATNGAYEAFIYGGARTNLGTLGGTNSTASGINNSNVVIGGAGISGGGTHAFRWTPGATNGVAGNPQMTDLGTLGGTDSDAYDVNLSGQVAGFSLDGSGTFRACRFNTNGTITDIGAQISGGLVQSYGYGINQSGQVVGSAYDVNFLSSQAFFYNGNNVLLLGDLTGGGGGGAGKAEAYAINNAAQITGFAINGAGEYHAFRRSGGTMTDLGTLGGTFSSGAGINNSNVIVGVSTIDAGDFTNHAFICASNTLVDLNTQLDTTSNSWVLIKAENINDLGQIVGYGTNNGALHGFLLTAVVPSAPVITNQPAAVTNLAGSTATFTVVAGGTSPLAYQWKLNSTTNLVGATNATLALTNVQATNAGNYSVVITNAYGSVTSSLAALTVVFAPSITNQPSSVTNVVGSNATFTVGVSGSAPLSYQWKFTTTALANATNATFTVTNAQATNVGNYSVVVTNNYGSVTSSAVALALNFPPGFTNAPLSQTALVTSNVTFTCTPTGTSPLTYRWRHAGTNVAATATNTTLTLTNVATTAAGVYLMIVTNNYGSATSAIANLTVVPAPVISSISVATTNIILNFSSSTGATYAVERRTNLISGSWLTAITNLAGNGATKTVTNLGGGTTTNGFYRVRVTVP
ncbi:MAG: hypothetical protein RLZZ350_1876 [Verrucomicrobiota bacterium]|jgi:probable HAF family extracellular repeat protein